MPQGLSDTATAGMAAGGQHQLACPQGALQAAAHQRESSIRFGLHLLNHGARAQLHAGCPGSVLETLNHRLGTVLLRKHPAVGLFHKGETVLIKPSDGITAGEAAEGATQRPTATRIVAGQLAWIPAGVGDVAPATATDAHLLKRFRRSFQNQHPRQSLLCGGDRCHVTGRTTTHDDQIKRAGSAGRRRCCSSACLWAWGRH